MYSKIVDYVFAREEAYRRFKLRPHTISEDEFKMLYRWEENLTVYDEEINNTNLTAEETVEKVNKLFRK